MNNKFKDYFSTSAALNKADMENGKVRNIPTSTVLLGDDNKPILVNGKKQYIPLYNSFVSLLEANSKYGQFGMGMNHCVRNAFVIDCDATISADYILEVCRRYFVEPTAIITTPKNHTQTFFVFTKSVITHNYNKDGKYVTEKGKKFNEYLHKLNRWLGIGDENFKGYLAKNFYSSEWTQNFCKETNLYPFDTLCEIIDNTLENTKDGIQEPVFVDYKETDIDYLSSVALGLDTDEKQFTDEEGTKHTFKRIEKYNVNPTTDEIEYEETAEIEVITEDEIEVATTTKQKVERRGKFKNGSENRHSTLFHIMKVNISSYNYSDEYVQELAKVYNTFFDSPLTDEELNREVFNEATFKNTFGTLRHWNDVRKYQKEAEKDLVLSIWYENGMDTDMVVSELKAKKWTTIGIIRVLREYFPEYDTSILEKAYKSEYAEKYDGKYDRSKYESVQKNKQVTKVRNWLKKNMDNNKPYPKKWTNEEVELAESMKTNMQKQQ